MRISGVSTLIDRYEADVSANRDKLQFMLNNLNTYTCYSIFCEDLEDTVRELVEQEAFLEKLRQIEEELRSSQE